MQLEIEGGQAFGRLIRDEDMLGFLGEKLGSDAFLVQDLAFGLMRHLKSDYKGGMWSFFETKNEGFYMQPPAEGEKLVELQWHGNGSCEQVSLEAAGITVTLFALSHASAGPCFNVDRVSDQYERLRESIADHPERSKILNLID